MVRGSGRSRTEKDRATVVGGHSQNSQSRDEATEIQISEKRVRNREVEDNGSLGQCKRFIEKALFLEAPSFNRVAD